MSLVLKTCAPIDNLIATSDYELEWIPCSQVTDVKPTQIDSVYYAIRKEEEGKFYKTIMLSLGNSEECTEILVTEFARTYSLLPTQRHNDNVNHFRRYEKWLQERSEMIKGFTKYDDNYYMVAHKRFYHCYSRYGFCTACGILRCSPVWCICGHKQLSNGWTSNNKQLDDFIKKTQLQTNSPNDAYLEWIPFDCIDVGKFCIIYLLNVVLK